MFPLVDNPSAPNPATPDLVRALLARGQRVRVVIDSGSVIDGLEWLRRVGGLPTEGHSWLRWARRVAGLTQIESEALVRYGSQGRSWRRWERGERPVPTGVLELFALKVGVPLPANLVTRSRAA